MRTPFSAPAPSAVHISALAAHMPSASGNLSLESTYMWLEDARLPNKPKPLVPSKRARTEPEEPAKKKPPAKQKARHGRHVDEKHWLDTERQPMPFGLDVCPRLVGLGSLPVLACPKMPCGKVWYKEKTGKWRTCTLHTGDIPDSEREYFPAWMIHEEGDA